MMDLSAIDGWFVVMEGLEGLVTYTFGRSWLTSQDTVNRHISVIAPYLATVEIGTRIPSSLKFGFFPPTRKSTPTTPSTTFQLLLQIVIINPITSSNKLTTGKPMFRPTRMRTRSLPDKRNTKQLGLQNISTIANAAIKYQLRVAEPEGHGKMFRWWKSWGQEVFHSGCRLSQLLIPRFYCGWALESLSL